MDILNDYYPLYPPNPDDYSSEDDRDYLDKLTEQRTRELNVDDYCMVHSDDLWYLWCMVNEFTVTNTVAIFDKIDYAKFCVLCYENSTRM